MQYILQILDTCIYQYNLLH